MNILCLGDLVGKAGRAALKELLPQLKKEFAVDAAILNAENAAGGSGITARIGRSLFEYGVDIITLGDHVWDRAEQSEYLTDETRIIRPANFPPGAPGRGFTTMILPSGKKLTIINLLGRVFMRYQVDCPFRTFEAILGEVQGQTDAIAVDFHAETTSERVAFGHFADGRVAAVFGTHTHIQTADETILPKGTAYITDLGMCGPYDSVIGQDKNKIIQRFLTSVPVRFEVAQGDARLAGAVIRIDETTGRATHIERIQRKMTGSASLDSGEKD